MLVHLEGKVAVVTGGASGIGRGIAEQLTAAGARVVVADIEDEPMHETAAEIGAFAVHTDVSDLASVEACGARSWAVRSPVDCPTWT